MKEPAEALIWTEDVTKVYNPRLPDEVRAVDRVSVTIDRGDVAVLKGPSGSGKTSLLSLIGCMSRPTSGRIFVDGRDVAKLSESLLTAIRRETFGFIFQQYNLVPDASVLENVLLPLYPVGLRPSEMKQRANRILEGLGIENRRRLKVRKLSGGEQQRVAIARALVNEPDIIVADEPTAHLDRQRSADLLRVLEDLNMQGKTIIIATHDAQVYDHVFVTRTIEMGDGRVEAERLS